MRVTSLRREYAKLNAVQAESMGGECTVWASYLYDIYDGRVALNTFIVRSLTADLHCYRADEYAVALAATRGDD